MSEHDKFVAHLPVWTLVRLDLFHTKGLGLSVAVFTVPEIGNMISLFTDDDLAKTFRERIGAADQLGVVELKTMAAVKHIVDGWNKSGVKHVGIDLTIADGRPPKGRFYPCDAILAALPAE